MLNRGSKDCDCSPKERRRLFHGFTTSACDSCDSSREGLLSRLRARFHGGDSCDSGCANVSHYGGCGVVAGTPTIGGCALPPVLGSTPAPLPSTAPAPLPPVEAPKPMEDKATPKTTNVSHKFVAPAPLPVPEVPVLAGTKSPF